MKCYRKEEGLQRKELLLVTMYEEEALPSLLCHSLNADISRDIDASYGKVSEVFTLGRMPMKRLLVLGLGKREALTKEKLRKAVGRLVHDKEEDMMLWLDGIEGKNISKEEAAYECAFAFEYSRYTFTKINQKPRKKAEIAFLSDEDVTESGLLGQTIAECVNHARDLGNTPSNYMTPEKLAEEAKRVAQELKLHYEILTNKELEDMKAGALLGVNRGSSKGARLITLWYEGNPGAPYTALVGKGLTFDAGGYNLKTAAGMRGMKFDMCGGANVLGAIEALARTKAKANIMAVIAATENKIGPDGYTCDDVLVSLSGKTIEITNTDAEGRLILCDAITYAQRQGAKRIIDMATLTGACVTALGNRYTGAFTNSGAFLSELRTAAKKSGELVWQLPVDEEFHEQVRKSNVADMTNAIPGAGGGSSLAAAFLEEFIEEGVEWIHLDIAGSGDIASDDGYAVQGASGAMVETLGRMF